MDERTEKLGAAREAVSLFCKLYGINIVGVMLYGSYAKGLETNHSDVDIIIVDEGVNGEFRVQREINGFKLQVKHVNYNEISDKLTQSPLTQQPFLPVSLCEAQILFDKFGLCVYLKTIAKKILTGGPQPADTCKVELIRSGFVNYLNDGTHIKYTGSTNAERVMWASQSIRLCMDIILAVNGQWIHYSAELKLKVMQTHYPKVTQSLNNCLSNFLTDYNSEKFAQQLKGIMEVFISFSWDTDIPTKRISTEL